MVQRLTVPLAGFTNPSYLTPGSQSSQGPDAAKGMDIRGSDVVLLYIENVSGTRTISWEQTLDPDGATGWFPVLLTRVNDYTSQSSAANVNSAAYFMPVIGVRYRGVVTALATADFVVWEHKKEEFFIPGAPATGITSMPALPTGSNTIGGVYEVPSSTAGAGIVPVKTNAAAASLVLKSSAGNLYGINADLPSGGIAAYLLLFDATGTPGDGAVTPVKSFKIQAAGSVILDFEPPLRFSAGCVASLSSTGPFTKTALTGAANLGFISGEIS